MVEGRFTVKAVFVLMTLFSFTVGARAPHTDDFGGKDGDKKRIPAATESVVTERIKSFGHYMDLSCRQLVDAQSQDEFISYFRVKSKDIHEDICSIVGSPVIEEEMDLAQAERRMIGLGTFSNLLEAHYNEFVYERGLEIYQNLDCKKMMDRNSNDGFIRFFANAIAEINVKLCDDLEIGSSQEMDNDMSQAERPIGLGTYSKLIETYYHDYHYRQ